LQDGADITYFHSVCESGEPSGGENSPEGTDFLRVSLGAIDIVSNVEYVRSTGPRVEGCRPADWSYLVEHGLPRHAITIFRATAIIDTVRVVLDGNYTAGVVLGRSREDDAILLNGIDGRVWLHRTWGDASPLLVNSTLPWFAESLALVHSRFPFYAHNCDLDDAEEAERTIRRALESIDPASTAEADGFWCAFLDDVAAGDYGAES
jgi:hypothetical protein